MGLDEMKKQAVVNQIKRESEVLEDRLLDKILSQVPSIVRRELAKIESGTDATDRNAKERKDIQRQIDTFSAFYKTEIRKIDEHLSDRMDQLTRDHTSNLTKILDTERSKVTHDAIEAATLNINNQMQTYKKSLLQLQYSWMPTEIQKHVEDAIDVHEKNCLVGKCAVDKSGHDAGSNAIPEKLDLEKLILEALSHTPPKGSRLSVEDKEMYAPHYIAKRACLSDSVTYRKLRELVEAGKVEKGEFLYGTQYGTAYWVDDTVKRDNGNNVVIVKKPLNAIKPAAVLEVLAKEIDPMLNVIPRDDIHTIYGIVKKLGFDDDRERDATKKVRTILYGLIRDELVLKKTIAVTYPAGDNRADWAYWRATNRGMST